MRTKEAKSGFPKRNYFFHIRCASSRSLTSSVISDFSNTAGTVFGRSDAFGSNNLPVPRPAEGEAVQLRRLHQVPGAERTPAHLQDQGRLGGTLPPFHKESKLCWLVQCPPRRGVHQADAAPPRVPVGGED